ncbi:MAG: class I SAM-dependent methyltransferase [Chloroflexota bacterium]
MKRIAEYRHYLYSMEEALATVTQQSPAAIKSALEGAAGQVEQPDQLNERTPIPNTFDASPELAQLCFAICRLMRPSKIVEIGVGNGQTSFYILKALHENVEGQLYSIDLPYFSPGAERSVGRLVPQSFRPRWALTLGPSQRVLRRMLPKIAPVDVFIHDGDHTYWTQLAEFRKGWSALRPGGVLIADDVVTDAFMVLANESGVTPVVVAQSNKPELIGILSKPT